LVFLEKRIQRKYFEKMFELGESAMAKVHREGRKQRRKTIDRREIAVGGVEIED
jgi:hypothetical protein